MGEIVISDRQGLYDLLKRFGLQGPPGDMETLSAVISAAVCPGANIVTFEEAEEVGRKLHDHWQAMDGTPPLTRDDLGWADIIQFTLRTARDVVDGREGGR